MNRSLVAALASATFVAFTASAQAPARSAPSAAQQQAPAASAWPQKASADGATYVMNMPSYTAINGNTVSMTATIQVKRGTASPVDGTVQMSAVMAQAADPGYVELSGFQIEACDMPDGSGDAVKTVVMGLLNGMAVESMLTTIVQGVAIDASRNVTGLTNPVPAIRVTERPAVLVSVNGQPAFGSCGAGWKRVVNTPSILLQSPDGAWYTRVGGSHWLRSASMGGQFQPAAAPPQDVVAEIGKAPAPPAGTDAPQSPAAGAQSPAMPDVVVATAPTLLVSMDGAPKLMPACDGVEWAANCTAPLLKSGGAWWTLGSGRWFTTGDLLQGPWTYVPAASLPAAFANLPAQGVLAVARASVPGTLEANSAAAASGIVRAITVPRDRAQCTMRYRGDANFKPIDGGLAYATNSTQPVIQAGNGWYCCDDGAWFKAGAASGPWTVCDSVPAEIYAIPPSCPAYACTYVSVVASTPESVTFGSTSGYMGTYMQDGTPVYGTGYDYNAADPQPVDAVQADVASYVAPSYPATYGNQAQYSYDSGTYAPEQGYGYYGYADSYPSVYNYGYGGWGWSPYWGCAYGYGCGWGWGWGYGDWGRWNRNWNNWGNRRDWNNRDNRFDGDRGLNGARDGAAAAANRWSGARDGNGLGGPRGARGYNAPRGSNAPQGYRSPQGYHSNDGYRGTSGFQNARYSGSGGYRSGGGSRGGRGGGGRR